MIALPISGKAPLGRGIVPTRVLVVDNEPLIRWSVCAALAAAGFDAVAAADAAEACRLVAEWPPPKVALLDLCSPDTEGQELVRHIRNVYSDCRFLMMTTARRGGSREAQRPGGVEVIEKPFDLGQLVHAVSALAEVPEADRRRP
jgi:DNA-binding NtrC family response regulator